MNPNILKILGINTWNYKFKNNLILKDIIFKYSLKSSENDYSKKSLLLINSNEFINKDFFKSLIDYLKNHTNFDVAEKDSEVDINNIKSKSSHLENLDYKKIIMIGNHINQELQKSFNMNSSVIFLDSNCSKKELWLKISK